jgi:hypothetical protein
MNCNRSEEGLAGRIGDLFPKMTHSRPFASILLGR